MHIYIEGLYRDNGKEYGNCFRVKSLRDYRNSKLGALVWGLGFRSQRVLRIRFRV